MATRPNRLPSNFLGHHKDGREEGLLADWTAIFLTEEPLAGSTHEVTAGIKNLLRKGRQTELCILDKIDLKLERAQIQVCPYEYPS